MNRNQFSLLLFLVVVLGIAGLMVYNKQNNLSGSGNAAMGKKLLPNLAFNDVAHIALQQGTNQVNLAKKDGTWRVRERKDYPANYSQSSDFLIKAADLKVVQSESIGPSKLARLELVPGQGTNSALEVTLKDQNDKQLQALLLGKKHMQKSKSPSPYGDLGENGWPDGRYVQVVGHPETVDVISDALANIEPKPEQWLNKDFSKWKKCARSRWPSPNLLIPGSSPARRKPAIGNWPMPNPPNNWIHPKPRACPIRSTPLPSTMWTLGPARSSSAWINRLS